MNPSRTGTVWSPHRVATVISALVVALLATVIGIPTARAAVEVPVSNVQLSWLWNTNSSLPTADGGSSSLSEARAPITPATLAANPTGFVFTVGSGTYDPYTGETHLDFEGALTVGNTSFGNFGQKIDAPSVDIDAAGNGTVTATVSTRGPGSDVWDAPLGRVVVATFSAPDDQVDVDGTDVSWTFTPAFVALSEGRRQWVSSFYDILPASMQPSYKESSGQGGNQPNKGPSPVSVSFSFAPPSLGASQTTDLDPAGQTITVAGAGFRPNINLFVANCDAGFDAGARCDFGHVAQATTDDTGAFSVPVTVVARFGTAGTPTDCLDPATSCAIQTSWVETPSDRSQEASLPIGFATPTPPFVPPTPDQLPTELAFTGRSDVPLAITGAVLVGLGLLLVRVGRRRDVVGS